MNTNKSYIAVVDVGSSAIRGCVGYRDESQALHILSAGSLPVGDEVRRGLVCNVKGTARIVREVVDALQQNEAYPCRISQVLASVNAASLRSKEARTVNGLQGEEEVTQDILDTMADDCSLEVPEGKELYFSQLKEYMVDGFKSQSPVGEKPKMLEAVYTQVYGKPEILSQLDAAFKEAGVDFTLMPGAWAAAQVVAPFEDRVHGCVVVDFGAETTTVCVIKDDHICHLVVIPLGGQCITNDLQRLSFSEEEAEQEKLVHGSAIHHSQWKNGIGPKELAGRKELSPRDKSINDIIVARAEEIVANVWAQIQVSGVALQEATIYLTGGASRLKDLEVLVAEKTNMRVVKVEENILRDDSCPSVCRTPEFSQCVGLLVLGEAEGCEAEFADEEDNQPETVDKPVEEPVEEPDNGHSTDRNVDNQGGSLFGDFMDFIPWHRRRKSSPAKPQQPREKPQQKSVVEKTMEKAEQKGMAFMDSLFSGDDDN